MGVAGLNLCAFTKCQPPLTTFKYLIFFKCFLLKDIKVNDNECTIMSYDKWENFVAYKTFFFR